MDKEFKLENEDNTVKGYASVRLLVSPGTVSQYVSETVKKVELLMNQAESNLAHKDTEALMAYSNAKSVEFDKVYKKLAHLRNHVKQSETDAVTLLNRKKKLIARLENWRFESDSGAKIERFGPLFDLLCKTPKGNILIFQQYGIITRYTCREA